MTHMHGSHQFSFFLNKIRHIYDLLKISLSMTHKHESPGQVEEDSIHPLILSNTI